MTTKTIRNLFLSLFLASTIVFVFLLFSGPMVGNVFSTINSSLGAPSAAPEQSSSNVEISVVTFGSIAASVTSFIGFLVTTVITWRKEKRESALSEIERKKLELELEKSRLELEELKKKKK